MIGGDPLHLLFLQCFYDTSIIIYITYMLTWKLFTLVYMSLPLLLLSTHRHCTSLKMHSAIILHCCESILSMVIPFSFT